MTMMLTGAKGMLGQAIQRAAQARQLDILPVSRTDADLLDYEQAKALFVRKAPDIILHCAARVSNIAANAASPDIFFLENQSMDSNVMWAAIQSNVKKLVLISSSAMYPPCDNPLPEDALLKGRPDPGNLGYSLAKAITAQTALLLSGAYKPQIHCLVAPNLYGTGDRTDPETAHLINAILLKIAKARDEGKTKVDMWGDGSQRREFLYVDDFAHFLLDSAASSALPALLNVGLGEDHSVQELYEIAARVLDWQGDIIARPEKPVGAFRKLLDSTRAAALGWQPTTKIEDGMKAVAQDLNII